jgi:hypothetical protein
VKTSRSCERKVLEGNQVLIGCGSECVGVGREMLHTTASPPSRISGPGPKLRPGPETNLLDLPPGARGQIVEEACRILRRCIDPNGPPQIQTGLVMGYVQSGKTTSFTTLTALARDNGSCPISLAELPAAF